MGRGFFSVRVWAAVAVAAALTTTGLTGAGISSAASRPHRVPAGTVPHASAVRGAQLWLQRLGPANATTADSVAVSPGGSTVFVTGQTNGVTGADTTVAYNAGTGARKWTKRSTSFSDGDTNAFVAVSPTGKQVFITGTSFDFKSGNFDYVTVAENAATGKQQWVKHYNGPRKPSDNSPVAVGVSPSGKTVFVLGYSYGKTSVENYATVAYNAATGTQKWVMRFTSPGSVPSSLAVSPTGKAVYVTGYTDGGSAVSPYATVAYNAVTGAQLWVKKYGTPVGGSAATSVAVSRTGGMVFVTGDSGGNYATVAYKASTGQQVWAKRYLGIAGTSGATSVAVSPTGKSVYVTGESDDTSETRDYVTIAYNAGTGQQQWLKRYIGLQGNPGGSVPAVVAVSPTGTTVYVTGWSANASELPDYATVAYSASTGAPLWVRRYDGHASGTDANTAYSMAISRTKGTVFVTGWSTNKDSYATVAYSG